MSITTHPGASSASESERDGLAGRWPKRRAAIEQNAIRIARRGSIASAAIALIATVTTPLGVGFVLGKALVIAGPIVLGVMLRIGAVSIALQQTRSRSRRLLLRWIPRVVWTTSLWIWAFALTPIFNIIAAPAAVCFATALISLYARWTVDREVRGQPPHPIEWAIVVTAAFVLVAVVLVLVAVGAFAAWAASTIGAWWAP